MKHKFHFFNSSIFTKFSILTAVIIFIVTTFSTTFLVGKLSQNIQDKDRLLVQETTEKLFDFFQKSYNIVFNQRTLLHSAGHIADSIASTREHPSDIYHPEHLSKINNYLSALSFSDSNLEEVVLFTADGKNSFAHSPKHGRKVYLGYKFNELSYIKDFKTSPAAITVIYDNSPDYLSSPASKESTPTITFIAKIFDMHNPDVYNLVGYLMMNYSINTVDATYNEITDASDGNYFVINEHSDVIYSNIPSRRNQKYSNEWIADSEIISSKTLSLSGLQICGTLSNAKLRQEGSLIMLEGISVSVIGILFAMITIFLLHRHYTKKFQSLAHAMDSFSIGKFDIQLPVNSKDEFGYLSEAFNSMSTTLEKYIRKNYLAETQRRTAELYALQAQINPHFLANTIESIRMHTMENDDFESAEMLKELGNLFRWMIDFNQDIVYIEDELEYIESYLDLQKFRFQDRLFVDIDLPPDIYYFGIPRFTLQPIVENAMSHGSPTMHPLTIQIKFTVTDEMLKITVTDNGPGVNDTELNKLNMHIRGTENFSEFGVALRNIHMRIQLLFGESYGLHVESKYCQSTSVIVTLPAKEKKELEQNV